MATKSNSTPLGGSVAGVKPPSGVNKGATPPMIDKRSNVGKDNFAKVRWSPGPTLGNHK